MTAPVVLVTGATGPAGRAAAARFARDGARLALNGTDEGRLRAMIAELDLPGTEMLPVAADLRDPAAAADAVVRAERHFGRLDVLLHLVGGWAGGTPVVDLDHGEVRDLLERHLWSTLHVLQAAVPGMVARGTGRIIAVSSPLATAPGPRGASYAMAKAAEEALIRSLAREVAGTDVTANLVVVRAIEARSGGAAPRTAGSTTPEALADVLAFLASPAGRPVNGARIPLDGAA